VSESIFTLYLTLFILKLEHFYDHTGELSTSHIGSVSTVKTEDFLR
jgi:hypothetical protein